MKVIIDIPETEFNHIKKVWSKRRGSIPHTNIAFGTPIPDNCTNGDMIKAMFPNAIIEINELGSMVHVKYNNHTCWVNYELEWWDAPYQKEVEE